MIGRVRRQKRSVALFPRMRGAAATEPPLSHTCLTYSMGRGVFACRDHADVALAGSSTNEPTWA